MGEKKMVIRCAFCGTETDDWEVWGGRKLCTDCYLRERYLAEAVARAE